MRGGGGGRGGYKRVGYMRRREGISTIGGGRPCSELLYSSIDKCK